MPSTLGGNSWIGSGPIKYSDQKGKVVLVEYWTFGCINCKRAIPYVQSWHKKYGKDGMVLIGIHTAPGCTGGTNQAKVFVGQRQEGFAVNLGTIFDLVNAPFNVISNRTFANAAAANSIQDKNVTSIAIEIHKDCLTPGAENVVGGWTTASVRQVQIGDGIPAQGHQTAEKTGGAWVQVSRLGMPLVNEVVIGLKDKDRFNASKPSGDGQFLNYVSNPTLPQLISLVQTGNAGAAPTNFPRTDLLNVFLAGVQGVNRPANVV